MSKRIALSDFIEVDGHDISDLCSAVQIHSDDEQVDVSGFSAAGSDEFLQGKRTQSVDLTVFGSYGSGEIHDVLYHIYRDRSTVTFKWRPDVNSGVSGTNPQLAGNVKLLSYGPGATRGQADSFQVTLSAADATGLVFGET